jgi:hypothetical protein
MVKRMETVGNTRKAVSIMILKPYSGGFVVEYWSNQKVFVITNVLSEQKNAKIKAHGADLWPMRQGQIYNATLCHLEGHNVRNKILFLNTIP